MAVEPTLDGALIAAVDTDADGIATTSSQQVGNGTVVAVRFDGDDGHQPALVEASHHPRRGIDASSG